MSLVGLLRRRDAQRRRRVLAVLLLHEVLQLDPPSGYPLGRSTGDGGSVYVALVALEDEGLIAGEFESLPHGVDRPRRRFYRLTDLGRAEAAVAVSSWLRGEEGR